MKNKELKIGDKVVLLENLISNLDFRTNTIDTVWETSLDKPGEKIACFLSDDIRQHYQYEIHKVDGWPDFILNLSDGEYSIIKDFLKNNEEYFKTNKIETQLNHRMHFGVTEPYLRLSFNFNNLNEFFKLGIEIGKYLNSRKDEIDELIRLNKESKHTNENEQAQANKHWNDLQDASLNNIGTYDEDGMNRDDEYNPNNWQGHD